jgi:hypothetical protein
MAKPLTDLTQDEAGMLVDFIDRGHAVDVDYDDLLLVASGLVEVLLDPRLKTVRKAARLTCKVCGKRFEAKRSDAKYCGRACEGRAYRSVCVAKAPRPTWDIGEPILAPSSPANTGGPDPLSYTHGPLPPGGARKKVQRRGPRQEGTSS